MKKLFLVQKWTYLAEEKRSTTHVLFLEFDYVLERKGRWKRIASDRSKISVRTFTCFLFFVMTIIRRSGKRQTSWEKQNEGGKNSKHSIGISFGSGIEDQRTLCNHRRINADAKRRKKPLLRVWSLERPCWTYLERRSIVRRWIPTAEHVIVDLIGTIFMTWHSIAALDLIEHLSVGHTWTSEGQRLSLDELQLNPGNHWPG